MGTEEQAPALGLYAPTEIFGSGSAPCVPQVAV